MKRIIAITAIVIISIVAVGVAIFWFSSANFKTSITQNAPQPNQPVANQQLETNYFTATLPVGYEVVSNTEKESGTERLNITAKNTATDTTINIIVGDIPSGGLNGLKIYTDRSQNPEQYTNQSFSGMPTSAQTFYSRTNGYELVAFWTYGSLYAAITISSPTAESGQINVTMQAFLDQWQWR